ncbi:MAG: hypothetical protein INQ03_20945 [Candidatus Heimdallarchaeota archaeon]|nr:hypothetical protein [Candidatus Heimdallarchaeota archaeon]
MGRTVNTFRMRLLETREQMMKMLHGQVDLNRYKTLYEDIQQMAAPASTFNWPDTRAVVTYMMLLDVMVHLDRLEQQVARKQQKID